MVDVRAQLGPVFRMDPIPPDVEGRYSRRMCSAPGCDRISQRKGIDICRPHWHTWERLAPSAIDSIEAVESWLASAAPIPSHTDSRSSRGWFDAGLAGKPLLRDQLAFGLMRRGERGATTAPHAFNRLARSLAATHVDSLLDLRYDREQLSAISSRCGGDEALARAFLLDSLDELCLLNGEEPTRRYLGIATAGSATWVNLNNVDHLAFRQPIQRWMEYRLNAELATPDHVQATVGWVSTLCSWLTERGVSRWEDITRKDLVEYLEHLKSMEKPGGGSYTSKYLYKILGGITTFFDEAAANEWIALRPGVRWMRSERPIPEHPLPRLIGERVAAALRSPDNLRLVEDLDSRLAIRIMAETGLRRKDVVAGCSVNCLLDLGDGKWSLRYTNHKGRTAVRKTREATTPITPDLAAAVAEHVAYKRSRYPANRHLFARDERDVPLTLTLINRELRLLIERLDLRGPDGEFVRVTPHMFRHQNATDWINAGVPLPVIQKLLDHSSMTTTQIYAHMSEQTVREQWERSLAVNAQGIRVAPPEEILQDAAWMHAFMGGATQALPNGRCGMPCSETCEHANACLECPLFITTPEYLPVLRAQRDEHETMMNLAETEGLQRIVERNRKPFLALSALIENLEKLSDSEVGSA